MLTLNGVFTEDDAAKANKEALELRLKREYKGERVKIDYVLNPSHLAGFGDALKAFKQKVEDGVATDDYDLIEMVKEASTKVTTQKLLLVAHSQGNFYANSFYDTVTGKDGGVPVQSIGMYSVATPSNHVSGGGKYLTSGSDKVISGLVGSLPLFKIMSPNDYIELKEGDDTFGHNFAGVYLKYKPTEIISDIEWSLDRLQTNDTQKESETCINAPKLTLGHKIVEVAFKVADPVALGTRVVVVETVVGVHTVGKVVVEQGTPLILALGNGTTKVAAVTASGVSAIGSVVGSTAAGTVTLAMSTGKFVGKTIAGAFSGSGQTASVASALGDPASELSVSGNPERTTDDQQPTTEDIPEQISEDLNGQATPSKQPLQDTLKSTEVNPPVVEQEVKVVEKEKPAEVVLVPEVKKVETPALAPDTPATSALTYVPLPQNIPVEQTQNSAPRTTRSTPMELRGDTTAPEVPVVTGGSTTLTTTSETLVGTAEAESVISTDFSSATTIVATDGSWSLGLIFPQGTTTIQFFATDSAGNVSVAATKTIYVDSLAPDASVASATCDNTLAGSTCLVTSTTLAFSWSSTASDVAYFRLDKNGVFSTTTATSLAATGTDEGTYTLNVSAVDIYGNISATSTKSVTVYTMPVVVNEIAWAGTSASNAHQWIELYNRTSSDISLSNWTLYASDLSPYVPLSGTIAASGYYLIESTNSAVSDVSADLVATLGMSISGEVLTLALLSGGATTTLDTVATCSGGATTWCAGDGTNYKTMERYDTAVSGTDSTNWYSHIAEFIMNGHDSSNAILAGTPKARNSNSYYLAAGGTGLSSDKTLSLANSPYLVGRFGFTVASGITLTIPAGVVIKFVTANSPAMLIQGTIHSNGTAANPVVFTSFYDDTYGGDMNADGSTSSPQAGNWKRLLIDTTSTGSSFTNTLVRYGGGNNILDSVAKRGAVGVDTATATFDGLIVENSYFYGLGLLSSNSTVVNSRFSTSTNSEVTPSGVYISGGSPSISSSTFSGNYRGLTVESAPTATITGNTFTSNTQEAYIHYGLIGTISGNSGSGNGKNAILLPAGTITTSGATTTLLANDLPYLIQGTATLAANSTLAFAQGVVVKGWDSGGGTNGLISVPSGASLYSSGTSVSDLVFTSMRDSTVGGTISSGLSAVAAGDWKGISVAAGGWLHLSGFTLKYGGASAMAFPPADSIYKGALKITGNSATSSGSISNALFANNYQSGLNLDSVSSLGVSNTTFQNHTLQNMGTASGIYALTSTSTLSNITFSGNTKDAIGVGTNALSCTSCAPSSPNTTPTNLFSP
ncbi:MAG: lamin tail domain-containing protein [bacterium]|nr:lamin tail domain-containing protein [bacterium]